MNIHECILDSLIDGDETENEIIDYFNRFNPKICLDEINRELKLMINNKLIVISKKWIDIKGQYPYSLTKKGKDAWVLFCNK